MPARHTRFAPVGEYQPTNITAATAARGQAIAPLYSTTSSTAVAGGATPVTVTVAAAPLSGFVTVGSRLYVWGGAGTAEVVTITAVNPTTPSITAVFANAHSGTYTLTSANGTKLGHVWINQVGTGMTLVLWNGPPDLASATPPSTKIASITPSAGALSANGTADQGLWVVYTGTTAGDVTLWTLADAV